MVVDSLSCLEFEDEAAQGWQLGPGAVIPRQINWLIFEG